LDIQIKKTNDFNASGVYQTFYIAYFPVKANFVDKGRYAGNAGKHSKPIYF
jgi:hypothetical protein